MILLNVIEPSRGLIVLRRLLLVWPVWGLALTPASARSEFVPAAVLAASPAVAETTPPADRLPRRRRASAARRRRESAPTIRLALGSAALVDSSGSGRIAKDESRYGFGQQLRSDQRSAAASRALPQRAASQLAGARSVRGESSTLVHERVKVRRPPTVAESAYSVATTGRPDGELIVLQLLPGGEEISLAPFVEGFREPEGALGHAAGRMLEGRVGLQLITSGSWCWRLQLTRRYRNTVFGGDVGSSAGVVLLRRF